MKKVTTLFILSFLLFNQVVYAAKNVESPTVTSPIWKDVVVPGADYEYMEPKPYVVRHPKWLKTLAWVGWIGTFLLVPFPFLMSKEGEFDSSAYNNRQFRKYDKIRILYERDIHLCEEGNKDNEKLVACYMNVKQHYQLLLTNMVNAEKEQEKLDDIQDKLDDIERQNRVNQAKLQSIQTQQMIDANKKH